MENMEHTEYESRSGGENHGKHNDEVTLVYFTPIAYRYYLNGENSCFVHSLVVWVFVFSSHFFLQKVKKEKESKW